MESGEWRVESGNVVLPMCVIKCFSDAIAPAKQQVLDTNAQNDVET